MAYQVTQSAIQRINHVTTRPIDRLPVEILVEIFSFAGSADDVHSLLLTSKKLYAAYIKNANRIAKAHIFRLLDPSDYKLAVMAIESRNVNPLDQTSLQRFFDDYIHHEEWGIKLFRMRTVSRLPELINAISYIVETLNESPGTRLKRDMGPTPGENARKTRAYYMQEVSLNLFNRMPGEEGHWILSTPNKDWMTKYWANFSPGEIAQAKLVRCFWYRWHLYDVQLCSEFRMHLPPLSSTMMTGSQLQAILYTQLCGIRIISHWVRPTRSGVLSVAKDWSQFTNQATREEIDSMCSSLHQQITDCVREAEQLGNPCFHQDPESISDEVWDMRDNEWNKYSDIDVFDNEGHMGGFSHRVIYDKSTVAKVRQLAAKVKELSV
ncbi:hypothetical protein F4677DRAFT_448263 [Hypoxylon crocopeplum]|nr:hypothetical protein F4677DRAFT_448263 [Hypoxylon crocopeplum]